MLTHCRATQAALAGDVGFYYLPYVEYILEQEPSCCFVCLQRDRTATIRSYLCKTDGKNHWQWHDGTTFRYCPWDACYPKYPIIDKSAAIGRYWDEYYQRISALSSQFPQSILTVPTEALNTAPDSILDHLGLPQATRVYPANRRWNASPTDSCGRSGRV